MRVFFDNVNFASSSGPNSFGKKLAQALSYRGHVVVTRDESPDVQLAFIIAHGKHAPIVQRLDGVWFNSSQDWMAQNAPIQATYRLADAVVVQTEFDRQLVETFFGKHRNVHLIRNSTDVDLIQAVGPLDAPSLRGVEKVWSCASSWRPHKRLSENIRYFQEHAGKNDCLVIAGENPDVLVADPRIFYAGNLDYVTLISLYRASDYFIHLAWLDHCPNVVVDAVAAGCHVICSSSGGTSELVGENSTVIDEDPWDFKPCELYSPPKLDFSRVLQRSVEPISYTIADCALLYEAVLMGVTR